MYFLLEMQYLENILGISFILTRPFKDPLLLRVLNGKKALLKFLCRQKKFPKSCVTKWPQCLLKPLNLTFSESRNCPKRFFSIKKFPSPDVPKKAPITSNNFKIFYKVIWSSHYSPIFYRTFFGGFLKKESSQCRNKSSRIFLLVLVSLNLEDFHVVFDGYKDF